MRKLLLLLASAFCAHANIVQILENTASSGAGIFGVGGYASGVTVRYSLDQYDIEDVDQPDLRQQVYFRYSYAFSALGNSTLNSGVSGFADLIIALAGDCGSDTECIFGVQTEGVQASIGAIQAYASEPGLTAPIHGIKFENLSPAVTELTLSFFSNRIPDGDGRIYLRGGDDFLVSDAGAVITPNSHVLPQSDSPDAAPEPATLAIMGGGLTALILLGRARRREGSS